MQPAEENIEIGTRKPRVFFAIWPDNTAQAQLGGLVKRLRLESLCGGRKTKAENIHLTLVFLGNVDSARVEVLCRVADGIRGFEARAFDFAIEEIHYWKHNRVIYAAPRNIPAELTDLVCVLKARLSAAGFSLEQRAYAPHITLMRNARCEEIMPELAEPIIWRAREWLLIKSEQASDGSIYSPIFRWPLS